MNAGSDLQPPVAGEVRPAVDLLPHKRDVSELCTNLPNASRVLVVGSIVDDDNLQSLPRLFCETPERRFEERRTVVRRD